MSNTRIDENRRRYHQQDGDGEEDGWVKVEPCRKKVSDVYGTVTTSRNVETPSLLHVQRISPSTMGLPTGYFGGEKTEESH